MSLLTQKIAGITSGATPTEGDTAVTKELATQGELSKEVTPDESEGESTTTETAGTEPVETPSEGAAATAEAPADKGTDLAAIVAKQADQIGSLMEMVKSLVEAKAAPAPVKEEVQKSADEIRQEALDAAQKALDEARTELTSKLDELKSFEEKAKEAEAKYAEIMARQLPSPGETRPDVDLHKMAGFISDPAMSEPVEISQDGFLGKSLEDFLR